MDYGPFSFGKTPSLPTSGDHCTSPKLPSLCINRHTPFSALENDPDNPDLLFFEPRQNGRGFTIKRFLCSKQAMFAPFLAVVCAAILLVTFASLGLHISEHLARGASRPVASHDACAYGSFRSVILHKFGLSRLRKRGQSVMFRLRARVDVRLAREESLAPILSAGCVTSMCVDLVACRSSFL